MLYAGGGVEFTIEDGMWVVCSEMSVALGEDVVGCWGSWCKCHSDVLALL